MDPQPLLANGAAARASEATRKPRQHARAVAVAPYNAQYVFQLAWQLSVSAVLVSVGGPALSLALLRKQYMHVDVVSGEAGVLDAQALTGVVLFIATVAGAAPILAGLALVYLAQYAHSSHATGAQGRPSTGVTRERMRATLAAVLLVCMFVICVVCAFVYLLEPGSTWELPNKQNALNQLLGGLLVCVYTFMAVASAVVAVQCSGTSPRKLFGCSRKADTFSSASTSSEIQADDWRHNVFSVVCGLLLLGMVVALSTFLTPVWNFQASSYFPWVSPFAINGLHSVSWGSCTDADADCVPRIVFKLYADVAVYFTFLAVLLMLGFVATYQPSLRRLLHRRVGLPVPTALKQLMWPTGAATLGELLVTALVAGLFGWWLWYWSVGYPRIRQEAINYKEQYVNTHVWARVMGHMTTLCMSFLVLPVARNSVWESAFGIPFERAVAFHRALGRLTWLLVTVHMVLWQAKWLAEGTLWHNVVTLNHLIITNSPATGAVHWDNFTIVTSELAWLVLTVVLVVAQFARRFNYELFFYTHHAVWFFLFAAVLHAWSHWYYTAAGLTLYAFDKVMRLINSTREAHIVSLTHAADAGVTRLVVALGASESDSEQSFAPHKAGQYSFICIPALAPFQWHPYTISSPPPLPLAVNDEGAVVAASDAEKNTITFHVKNMGAGTWSAALAALALAVQQEGGDDGAFLASGGDSAAAPAPSLSDLSISLDGPYGRAGHYYQTGTVILVAGGIGITPMLAIATDLARRHRAAGAAHGLRTHVVHLVWSVRERALVAAFADALALLNGEFGAQKSTTGLCFYLHLHLTKRAEHQAKTGPNTDAGVHMQKITPRSPDYDGAVNGFKPRPGPALPGRGPISEDASTAPGPKVGAAELGWCSSQQAAWAVSLLQAGRPDLESLVDRAVAASGGGDDCTVMVCGPAALTVQASDLALRYGTHFHSETFEF